MTRFPVVARRLAIGLLLGASVGAITVVGACSSSGSEETGPADVSLGLASTEPTAALAAFDVVYEVLQHPRCMNCHPAGDRPLQFDDSRPHVMNVQRGEDGRGRPGMRCNTCHGVGNLTLPHLPPGVSADWHLAPPEMVFEGLSKRQLAQMLLDPKRSHMTKDELVEHVSHDALVLWGWNPGPGRTPVPIPHDEFVAAFTTWIKSGAPVPEETRR